MIYLCLMVKNEAHNLPALIDSCGSAIYHIIALDTGSTDDTVKLLKARGATVYEEPFVNYAVSRTRLMELAYNYIRSTRPLASNDWFLLADGDMVFHGDLSKFTPLSPNPVYAIQLRHGDMSHFLPRLLSANRLWKFKGAVHEYLERTEHAVNIDPTVVYIEHKHTGSRSQGDKFIADLGLLAREHLKNPQDPRSVFYLANTMRDLGMTGCAKLYYQSRIDLGGWDEEVFESRLNLARLNDDPAELITVWLSRPSRAEPLFDAVRILRGRGMTDAADSLDKIRATIPLNTKDILFVKPAAYSKIA